MVQKSIVCVCACMCLSRERGYVARRGQMIQQMRSSATKVDSSKSYTRTFCTNFILVTFL